MSFHERPEKNRRCRRPSLLRAGGLAILLIPAAACFERPVEEALEIRFLARGGLVASSSVRIRKPEQTTAAMDERLARTRRDLETGADFWSRQFASLEPASERLVQDRTEGVLFHAAHRIYLKRPADLRALLARAAGSVRLASGEGWSELALAPLPGSRADATERRSARDLLEDWSVRIARYLDRVAELYRYADAHPDRAEICLAPLFEDETPDGETGRRPAPTDEERALAASVQESMNELIAMFAAEGDAAWTPDERVQLAYDPFPSRLVVVVPGPVLESEGFVMEKEGRWAVPEGGLFGALASLEGAWVAPDPFVASIRHLRADPSEPFDLAAFAVRPRTARSGASEAEVRRALDRALDSGGSYRLRWAAPPDAPTLEEEGPDAIDWDSASLSP
jgi:hypothetical protein